MSLQILTLTAQCTLHIGVAQTLDVHSADSHYILGNYSEAIKAYTKEGSLNAELQIPRAYNAIGNNERAVLLYEAIIAKAPAHPIARFELGKQFFKINQFENAAVLFHDLIEQGSKNPEYYYYYMGRSMLAMKAEKEGIQYLKSAFDLYNTHLRTIHQLGKYYVIKREKDSVLKYVDKGLEFYGDDVALLNWKVLAFFNNDEYHKALPILEHMVALREIKEYITMKLAFCYYKTWALEKAKKTYKIVLETDGRNGEALYNLGEVFWKDRQLDSAQYYIKKSIGVREIKFSKEYERLGQIAREQNDFKAAADYYNRAFDEDRSNYRVYYNVCTLMDRRTDDPRLKLGYYENFLGNYGNKIPTSSIW